MTTLTVRVARIYDQATEHDGNRVLVDRLWPRGMSKSRAEIGETLLTASKDLVISEAAVLTELLQERSQRSNS